MSQTRCTIFVSAIAALLPICAIAADECPPPQLALGRPHMDFVQWQSLPARVLGPTNSMPGVKATAMSYDAKGTRAVTVMFEFPAGWTMDKAHYINSDQEFLVLAGQIEFDGVRYATGDYAYLPAGLQHTLIRSEQGATLLNFYEGEHLAFYAATPKGMYEPRKLVRRIETAKLRWKKSSDGSLRKLLRRDRRTGEETWLLQRPAASGSPSGAAGHARSQESVEEFFVIDGELATPRGVMRSGAYAWRAPQTRVGPELSRGGFTALLRAKGGAPKGSVDSAETVVAADAPYAPCIPDNLRKTVMPQTAAPPAAPPAQ